MPALTSHQSSSTTKALILGDSGAGKTGALASLAAAGYNLRVIDMDNGMDVLANLLMTKGGRYGAEAASRVVYETITDPMKMLPNGRLVPSKATAWNRAIRLLSDWKTDSESLGPITSWSPQEVLVIDSLTLLCNAAMNFVLSMNARLGQPAQQADWFVAQQMIEGLLQMLYDEAVRCNVIINCHITYIGEENGPQRGYPLSLGKALSPKIGRYFNSALMIRTSGGKKEILTTSQGMIELKNTAPLRVAAKYPIETGLADYFAAVRREDGAKPQ